jgi:septal ring factor EnvC (AmiA/AmiB activator)
MEAETKQPGQAAYEARWQGIGYAVPWRYLYGPTRERWAAVEAACAEDVRDRCTRMLIEAAETAAHMSAALAGAEDTRDGLRAENARLRHVLGRIADTMEAARETLASRRKFDMGLLAHWDRDIADLRQVAAPGLNAVTGEDASANAKG